MAPLTRFGGAVLALLVAACARPAGRERGSSDTAFAPAAQAPIDPATDPAPADPAPVEPAPVVAAAAPVDSLPVVDVRGRAVIAVWAEAPDSLVEADEGLATVYDDFMYYLADARPRLDSLGIESLHQPLAWGDRRLRVRAGARTWVVGLPGSAAVGFVFVGPSTDPRVLRGVMVDEQIADSARALLPPS